MRQPFRLDRRSPGIHVNLPWGYPPELDFLPYLDLTRCRSNALSFLTVQKGRNLLYLQWMAASVKDE
jgi:hypothetical protein